MNAELNLPFTYDFDRALERLSGTPVNSVDHQLRLARVPMEEGNLVTVRATGTSQEPNFIIEGIMGEEQLARIKWIFHFEESLDGVAAHFAQTDLAPIFKEHIGTPLVRSFSLYGELMKSIIHQQLNLKFANTLLMRFVEKYGSQQEGVWRYPSPKRIATVTVEELRELQFSTRKAEYVIGLSQAIAAGALDLESLRSKTDEEVVAELTAYRGVGPWTAQGLLMFGLGRPNLFPTADIGLQNALKILWKLDRKPTQNEIRERFSVWSPYLSYAALYLWRSIEVPAVE
ncbi:DNA-3-methyladenine glycosylase family protein [Sporosarcina gallistercoris]|uniref:DNA-3-methyladenine glycosylase II n=1 Tax=Sporosarcina gallistercoris TaxID=2762245 RepID=A0ABR8PGL5_9BACL|nr:DNA-3-methyladenine glycosylase [Sporosarcina gallistercoris]MBD7907315.1 DNA-3-methyladenine glycosylase 2 family protein [Sporosarcina gallistercoris]